MWPFNRKKPIDPGRPHAYQAHVDPGIAAVASGAFGPRTNINQVAATSAYVREDPSCSVPGCGRPRDHDLHATAG